MLLHVWPRLWHILDQVEMPSRTHRGVISRSALEGEGISDLNLVSIIECIHVPVSMRTREHRDVRNTYSFIAKEVAARLAHKIAF